MTIRLHIDRVVIDDGAVPSHAAGFAEVLQVELGGLLAATPASVWGASRRVRMLHADAGGLGAGKPVVAALASALHRVLMEDAR